MLNYMDRFTIVGVLAAVKSEFQIDNKRAGLLQTAFMIRWAKTAAFFFASWAKILVTCVFPLWWATSATDTTEKSSSSWALSSGYSPFSFLPSLVARKTSGGSSSPDVWSALARLVTVASRQLSLQTCSSQSEEIMQFLSLSSPFLLDLALVSLLAVR